MNYLAQIKLGPLSGFGPLGNPEGSGIATFSKFLSSIIGLITIIGIIWFTFIIITGAISWIGSGGDKAAVESAKKRITNGLIGLIVLIAGIFILDLIGNLIGIPNILNLGQLFEQIQK